MAKRLRELTKAESFTLIEEERRASNMTLDSIDLLEDDDTPRPSLTSSEPRFSIQEKTMDFGTRMSYDSVMSDDEVAGQVIHLQKPSVKKQLSDVKENSREESSNSPSLQEVQVEPDVVPLNPSDEDSDYEEDRRDQKLMVEAFQSSPPQIKRRVLKSLKKDILKEFKVKDSNVMTARSPINIVGGNVGVHGDLSDRLTKASEIGTKMVPKIVFPAAPKLFRDAWVMVELLLTIVQFVYAFFSTDYRINRLYNALYIILSTVNLVLALIDSFYYFYELGSCMILYKRCRKRMKKRQLQEVSVESPPPASAEGEENSEDDSDIDDEEMHSITKMQPSCCKCCRLSPENKERLNMWFELIRNILSELLLYPLVVMDLFGLISDPDIEDKANFAFFLIGSFYLVLSVYIARVVISVLTLLTMKNLLSATESGKKNVLFIIRFLFHSIAQVVVHLCCIVAVGIKINQENDHNEGYFHASPIVWLAIFGGWFIPFIGVISYFIVNYFWTQQFSIGFFIQLVALLQEGDVVGSLMQSKSEMQAEAEDRAEKILEKMQYKKMKKEYKERGAKGRLAKLFYPVKLPLFIGLCIVYNIALGGFFAVLLLTSKNGEIVPIDFGDTQGICLLVIIGIISFSNFHIMLVSYFSIFVFLVCFVVFFLMPGFVSIPLVLLLIFLYRKVMHKKSKVVDNLLHNIAEQ